MIWIYDDAIIKDLKEDLGDSVAVLNPDQSLQVIALLQEDKIKFPIVAFTRDDNFQIKSDLVNFTRMHRGIPAVFDSKENTVYNEKSIPIDLKYEMTVMASSQADLDEIIRELIFKYTEQYFITVELPYEAKRQIRVGLSIHPDDPIQWDKTPSDYISGGTLLSGKINLFVDGAILVSYTGMHLKKADLDLELVQNRERRKDK